MKSICLKLMAISFSVFFFGNFALAEGGKFLVVKGEVKVQKADNQTIPAKIGSQVQVGETVITGNDSRAKIVMPDRNVISISPSTTMKIEKYTTGADKNVELTLSEGKVRSDVKNNYDGEKTQYLIKTPTAVAGVRGTQFITSFDSKTNVTEVITFKGTVALSSVTGSAPATVLVNKGQSSTVKKDSAPEPPKAVPTDRLKSMDKESGGKDTAAQPKESGSAPNAGAVDNKDKVGAPVADVPVAAPNVSMPPPPPPPPPATPKNPSTKTKVKVVPTTTPGASPNQVPVSPREK